MNFFERLEHPTPKFFRFIRNLGVALTSLGGSILAAPGLLPSPVLNLAGYVMVAGMVATIICQAVIRDEDDWEDNNDPFGPTAIPERNPLLDPNR